MRKTVAFALALLFLLCGCGADKGEAQVAFELPDDIASMSSDGANLISNPGFEDDELGAWELEDAFGRQMIVRDFHVFNSGNASGYLAESVRYQDNFSQDLREGLSEQGMGTYYVEAHFKSENLPNCFSWIGLRTGSQMGWIYLESAQFKTDDADFSKVYCEFGVEWENDLTYAKVYFFCEDEGYWLDDVVFRKISDEIIPWLSQ